MHVQQIQVLLIRGREQFVVGLVSEDCCKEGPVQVEVWAQKGVAVD